MCGPNLFLNPQYTGSGIQKWMYVVCTVSFWVTILMTVVSGLNEVVFHLTMPLYLACLTGLSFPDVNLLSDDSSQNHCTNIYHPYMGS